MVLFHSLIICHDRERSLTKSDFTGSDATALSFSYNGKLLSVGAVDGSVVLLDLESSNHITVSS